MIEIQNVSKSYNRGAVKAVADLDLTVPAGQIFGFLGPNGAGKSTTLKMIVGLLKPDCGRIAIAGMDSRERALECKRITTYVPENPEVYERLTGLEYLQFLGDIYRVAPADRQSLVERWSAVFEMESALADPIKSYSHGMRQKIVLMGALLPRPRVMIMDEPLVGLDPRAAHQLKEMMRSHCDQGGTLFFSTHIMEVAERICDRIAIISHGRLIACGTMEELRAGARGDSSLENIFLELTEK